MTGDHQLPWRLPAPGRARLGRYRLVAEIARGGIGAVYLGRADEPSGFCKHVALKTLRPELAAEPALVRMLTDEAQLAARLHHPHIAQLYDLGDDGGPFLVMEYVHGESLSAVLASTDGLPVRIAVSIAADVCDALAYAHALRDDRGGELGLVHRDVSPQNIVIDYEGVPRLLDFGIARVRRRGGDTERGVVKGRLAYMAPEQRACRPVDRRADLYSLGVVLYQASVGVHPWELTGADAACGDLPDPRPRRPELSDALWEVIARATAADPARRFDTADDMLAALREVASGLGPAVDRREVAALLDAAFAERRAAKQQLLDGRPIDGDTEILARTAAGLSNPVPAQDSGSFAGERLADRPVGPRPPRLSWHSLLSSVFLAVLLLTAFARSHGGSRAPAGRLQRPCLLVDSSGALADRDAAWLAIRLIGLALDGHPALEVRHGYRVQDREGWNPSGQVAAEQACTRSGADGVVVISTSADGRPRATQDGRPVTAQTAPGLAGAAQLAEQLAARWAPAPAGAPTWRATLPDWPAGALRPLLEIREGLILQRPELTRRWFGELVRDGAQPEVVYLAEAIARWWSGDLDDAVARASLPHPTGASERTEVLLAAITDLAAGREAHAEVAVNRLLEDARWADDPFTLYIGGEARIHSGRPAEGARLLERALAADPQLTSAIYHVVERRLTEGDWAGVERMARLWDRVEPGSPRAVELRGTVLLGSGRYADASHTFESLLDHSRSDAANLHLPQASLIYARLLSGDPEGAVARALVASTRLGGDLALTSVLPEPILYAWALGRGDHALAEDWEARLRQRLAGKDASPNYWQLAYTLAILDQLAGRSDARTRWIGAGPRAAVPRRYRFEAHARLLAVLEARGAGNRSALADAARDERDLPAFHLARALLAEDGGRSPDTAELESAMASSPNGDFDCVAAALLVQAQRAARDGAGAAATCRRILIPRVPRPYCLVARRDCPTAGLP